MSKPIWVVEEGEYSDYKVVGVFSTKENADLFVSQLDTTRYSKPSVSEWALDPNIDEIRAGLRPFAVWIERDGTVNDVLRESAESVTSCWDKPRQPGPFARNYRPGVKQLRAYVWAKDEAHAVKIAGERRRRLIADGEWEEQ